MTEEHRWVAAVDVAMKDCSPPTPAIWAFVKGKLRGVASFPDAGKMAEALRMVASKCELEGLTDSERMDDEIDIFVTVALAAGWAALGPLLLLRCVCVSLLPRNC